MTRNTSISTITLVQWLLRVKFGPTPTACAGRCRGKQALDFDRWRAFRSHGIMQTIKVAQNWNAL
jgi:hypothetical protein